jgi:hypothetical protein
MKKFTFVSGAIPFSLVGLGLLLKILHLPAAEIIMALRVLIFYFFSRHYSLNTGMIKAK